MLEIFKYASEISTPLMLGGFIAAVLFFIFRQILKISIFPSLTKGDSANLLRHMVNWTGTLSLVALILGFTGYVLPTIIPAASATQNLSSQLSNVQTEMSTSKLIDGKKKLNVVIVLSEGAPYERTIIDSFLGRLKEENKVSVHAPPAYDGAFIPPRSIEGQMKWKEITDDIRSRYRDKDIDYLVAAGTFASTAIMDADLINALHAKGLIFLGVTDPVKAGLVKSIDQRYEDSRIAGVRYGMGGYEYGKAIASLFPPEQKLVFVYDENTPQDSYVASDLNYLKQNGYDQFVIRPFNRPVEPNDLGDPNGPNDTQEIYFAWYGLDNMLRKPGGVAALKEKWVIPSTYTVENKKDAGIVVSVDDQKIGELGADILLKNYLNPNHKLGYEPVVTPPFKAWFDCETIHRKGMRLAPEVPNPSLIREDTCSVG